jgi:hypothetical protein
MSGGSNGNGSVSPFPALTPGQRLFFEVNGYVVIENTLTPDEVRRTKDALVELRSKFKDSGDPSKFNLNGCRCERFEPHFWAFQSLLEASPAIFEHLTHPLMVALAEEAVGGKVRLEESAAIINRREPDYSPEKPFEFGFHRGGQPGFDSYIYDDLYHCTFMKTLTNLTDLGPDDGGTAVIAGSHKLNCDEWEMVEAAYENPKNIHQVEAPAGSTMLMCETLIHATGQNRTENERVIIIAGFSHPKHQAIGGWEPSPKFVEKAPEEKRQLIAGHPFWTWPERHRRLGAPVHQENVPFKARMWSVTHDR